MSCLRTILPVGAAFWSAIAFGQGSPTFAVASVKVNQHIVGKDARQNLAVSPGKLSGSNVPLMDLIVEAYHVQPFQVVGGPNWLDSDEYEIDARADSPADREQLRLMLRTLLADRFRLSLRQETRDLRAYTLVVDKRGSKLQPAKGEDTRRDPRNFRGDMGQFATLLSVQLSIPLIDDPTRPSRATGAPVPVVDKTGLEGNYDISVDLHLEPGVDMFTLWQRILQDQLGLKLENQRTPVNVLLVERAERVPTAN